MRKPLFAAIALFAGLAAPALAQQNPAGMAPEPQRPEMHGGWEGGPAAFLGHGDMHRAMLGMMGLRELASGFFFRMRSGDSEADIHCPPSISIQQCVGAASSLMSSFRQFAGGYGGNR